MTDELEAAIAAGLLEIERNNYWANGGNVDESVTNTAEAFAAYRDRFHALEADNERTNRDRSALCIDFALLTEENARLRAALLPFAQTWAAYQRDYNSDINTSPLYEFIGEELNWFKMWMQHDGYKVAQEADYQQAAAMTAVVEASSTTQEATE